MLPETNAGHLMWHEMWWNFIKSANHFNVICRNKAILGGGLSIDWALCTVELVKTQSLIWGHVHQADLSMCFVSCISVAEVLTPLLCRCCLVILSQNFGGHRKLFGKQTYFAATRYFWCCKLTSKTLKEKRITRTESYYRTPFFHTVILFKEGFICCMDCSQHIYILCEVYMSLL